MTKSRSFLPAVALMAAFALPSFAADEYQAVVHDARGNPVMDARGNCVNTQWSTPTDECGAIATSQTKLASVYFDFNKAVLTKKSVATLNQLLKTLRHKQIHAVTIAGYADAIGSNSYNQRLSEKRARTVQHFLRAHGFRHANTVVRALGKSMAESQRHCKGLKDGKLHACMQEDRRVDIELSVTRQ